MIVRSLDFTNCICRESLKNKINQINSIEFPQQPKTSPAVSFPYEYKIPACDLFKRSEKGKMLRDISQNQRNISQNRPHNKKTIIRIPLKQSVNYSNKMFH